MGRPTKSTSPAKPSAAHTPAPKNGSTSSRSPAPTLCDTSTFTARNIPNPKQTTVHTAMPPSPTPANDADPKRPTKAVSTTVMTVNDKVETVIGQASVTSSRNSVAPVKGLRSDDWDTKPRISAQNAKKPRDLTAPRRLPTRVEGSATSGSAAALP